MQGEESPRHPPPRHLAAFAKAEAYLTASAALVFGILGALNLENIAVLSGATLALLALVATSSLAGRRQVADLDRSVRLLAQTTRSRLDSKPTALHYLSPSTSGAAMDLARSKDVRLAGVTLSRTLRTRFADLQNLVHGGGQLHVAIVDPESQASGEAARRCSLADDPQIFAHRIQPSLDLLRRLGRLTEHGGSVEVRLLDFVPACGFTLLDPHASDGRIQIDLYSHRPAASEPVLQLRAGVDAHWYRHFLEEFEAVWSGGSPLDLGRSTAT